MTYKINLEFSQIECYKCFLLGGSTLQCLFQYLRLVFVPRKTKFHYMETFSTLSINVVRESFL